MKVAVNSVAWQKTTVAALVLLLSACSNHSPAPVTSIGKDYASLERGSFRGSYYEVKKGDTLYFISYITGRDVAEIIANNKLTPPYTIYPGQSLELWKPKYVAPAFGKPGTVPAVKIPEKTVSTPVKPTVKPAPPPAVKPTPVPPVAKNEPKQAKTAQKTSNKDVDQARTKEYSQNSKSNKVVTKKGPVSNKVTSWSWPTRGRVVGKFSNTENGNKGIDIAGQRGQTVKASAAGVVVYAGNALRGYGNLVIIKHNDDYLSAYAHNDTILVKEQQTVHAGQKIAAMGSSGTNSVRLHFEIRYKGKSVNPLRYLPK
ncbi:murein hydrolase activator NlpD [Photobacterium sp. TY1-4]|uniref:murein hydrolase activator NlpD n=1 Tax=Photobacterium sp. TY1-4 TaxID=2899122 RepID=UPI0021C1E930|nr:murein hydrolase activator NlpD [Photobacterium sp. TY1-4]UXI01763.1 murein hydrolase activator NlpD [Photobacterium sp. TY1-4]